MVVLAAGLLCGCVAGFAQAVADGSTANEPLQVTSRLVVLDVVVLDRNGNFVSNLDQSKFHIVEDKVPQTIRNFDPPTAHVMPPGSVGNAIVHSTADLGKIGNAPVNVLVIDELNTPFNQIAYTQQMMTKYLRSQPEVLPVPTLFIAAGAQRIQVLHDFTQSRADLLASVKTHVTDVDFTAMMSALNGGRQGHQNGMVLTMGALTQVSASMRGFPGRKNVIWVGTGYKRAGDLQNLSMADSDKVVAGVRTVINGMQEAHITLYTIDPEGPASHEDVSLDTDAENPIATNDGAGVDVKLGLDDMAVATGGRVMFGRNDIETEIAKTATEGTSYYTLTYRPTGSSEAGQKFRRIRVTVDDPSLQVVTREGYFGGRDKVAVVAANTEKRQPKQIQFDLLNAARTTMVYTGLHSDAVRAKDGYSLLVTATDLHWDEQADGSRRSEVTVVAVCYDAKGKELSQHAAELKEEIGATDRIDNGARVGFAFPMAPVFKTARIRFVVRDANTGTMGSVNAAP